MPEDHRYETALRFALAIIHEVDRPGLTRPAKLARVTYAVLDAIYQAEGASSAALPKPGQDPRVLKLNGGSHERSKLPATR